MDPVDVIYEAAFCPELWRAVLLQLAKLSDSIGSALFVFDDVGPARGVTLDNLDDLLAEFLAVDKLRFSTSVMRMSEMKPNSFIEVDAHLTAEEIQKDPIRIRLRERGFGVNVCTSIPMPTGELVMYALQRPLDGTGYTNGAIERLNSFRPHLARAGLIAARLGLEQARNNVSTMQTLGLAAAVCRGERLQAANPLFLTNQETFRVGHRDRISLTDPSANELLKATLRTEGGAIGAQVRSFPLPATESRPPGVLHAIPLRRSARELFYGGDTMLVFTPVSATQIVPAPSILSGLFDLSPSEARLAASLASGTSLKGAASANDIKVTTARRYLEQIFRKTGTNQQSQLVALLKSASVIRSR